MATVYKTPGVFVEEISTLPASVAQVATAIPAFIGYTELGDLEGVPTRITSFVEYVELFGNAPEQNIIIEVGENDLPVKATVSYTATGPSLAPSVTPSQYKMYHTVQHYFANGGGPCWIVAVGTYGDSIAVADLDNSTATSGLSLLAKEDEPTLILFPDITSASSLTTAARYGVFADAMAQCEALKDRFTIIDLIENSGDDDHVTFRTNIGNQNLKYGAAYYPWLQTTLPFNYIGDDTGSTVTTSQAKDSGGGIPGSLDNKALNDAALTDEFVNAAIAEINKIGVKLSPGGAMAGIYATVDRSRGVWKAPANVSVGSVVKPCKKITDDIQETMNVDANGKSINAIRTFTGQGTLVWGARTLDGNSNEWRYVPVRRLFITAEESIRKATEFVVFEPNDANTWSRVRGTVENYLTILWRQGALAGAKPEDAFFVKVGLGETMTSQDILEGRMIVEIGMAAVRPAEFIILRFSHKLQES